MKNTSVLQRYFASLQLLSIRLITDFDGKEESAVRIRQLIMEMCTTKHQIDSRGCCKCGAMSHSVCNHNEHEFTNK